ncbi:MAG: FecR domain-containing protein [Bacteroidota bacterium]
MHDLIDLLYAEDLTPARRQAVEALVAERPDLQAQVAQLMQVRHALRRDLALHLPDRQLLVLHALTEGPDALLPKEDLSPQERQALLDAKPSLDQALAAFPALHLVVDDIRRDASLFDAAWAETTAQARPDPRPATPRAARPSSSRRRGRWIWRTAVGTALVLFVGLAVVLLQRDAGQITVTAEGPAPESLSWADGTSIRLQPGAQLQYQRGEGASVRQVTLRGQAYFDVATGPVPFTVTTEQALLTVLGTSFGVEAAGEATDVVLASGRLSLAPRLAPDALVVLEPGQASRVVQAQAPTAPEPVDLLARLAWSGRIHFHATPLSKAVERLQEHYEVTIEVEDDLMEERVTGSFEDTTPVGEILEVLALAVGGTSTERAEGVYRIALP